MPTSCKTFGNFKQQKRGNATTQRHIATHIGMAPDLYLNERGWADGHFLQKLEDLSSNPQLPVWRVADHQPTSRFSESLHRREIKRKLTKQDISSDLLHTLTDIHIYSTHAHTQCTHTDIQTHTYVQTHCVYACDWHKDLWICINKQFVPHSNVSPNDRLST